MVINVGVHCRNRARIWLKLAVAHCVWIWSRPVHQLALRRKALAANPIGRLPLRSSQGQPFTKAGSSNLDNTGYRLPNQITNSSRSPATSYSRAHDAYSSRLTISRREGHMKHGHFGAVNMPFIWHLLVRFCRVTVHSTVHPASARTLMSAKMIGRLDSSARPITLYPTTNREGRSLRSVL